MLPLPEVGGTLPPIINQAVLNEWALSFTETDLLLLHCNSTDTVPALRKVVIMQMPSDFCWKYWRSFTDKTGCKFVKSTAELND